METRLPTSPVSKEMGSRIVSTDQDAGTMVAQPSTTASGTNTSISRSMSRYKGPRRNVNPSNPSSQPKIPAAYDRHLPHLSKSDASDACRNTSTTQTGPLSLQEVEPRLRRRAQSIKVPQPVHDRGTRDGALDHPLQSGSNANHSTQTKDMQKTEQTTTANMATHSLSNATQGLKGGRLRAGSPLQPAARNLESTDQPVEQMALRPTHGKNAKSQEEVPPLLRPVPVRRGTEEGVGTSPRRMERQVPRPQAFEKSTNRAELKRMISGPIPIEPQEAAVSPPRDFAEPAVAPAFDAPISAVNAGSRMVRVKYEGTEVAVPITPSTTPIDIIRAAAKQIPAAIDERSTVVLESFKQIGLERPLRKYEHIRDVLNSWDYDAQNTLLVVTSPTGGKDDDLDVRNVSQSQPEDTTVYLYHSQKPGHWDKRWVTLRSDGQVLVAKKNGGETANICHLSDFDIYIPTPRYMSKKIKPPKKVCFAVKSQQKSSMFMSTANFVHFFSTSDPQLATSWYKAVQEWRSWYLVNVMGEGQKSKDSSRDATTKGTSRGVVNGTSATHHRSLTEKKPRTAQEPQPIPSMPPTRNPTTRAGPSSFPRKLPTLPSYQQPQTQTSPPPDPFAPTSLLGRTYTQRQAAQQRRSHDNHTPPLRAPQTLAHAQPPPSTASAGTSSHRETIPSAPTTGGTATTNTNTNTNLKRTSSSARRPPKPLIDLTPQYQPPPQHSRKGRGWKPEHVPAGGLIEVATSPEVAIQIPPSKEWRRPGTAGGGGGG